MHASALAAAAALTAVLAVLSYQWMSRPGWRTRAERSRLGRVGHPRGRPERVLLHLCTTVGQWWVLLVVAAVVTVGLVVGGRVRAAALLAFAAVLAPLVVVVGKLSLVRSNSIHQYGFTLGGYPSGHTADSTVLIGALVLLAPSRARPLLALAAAGAVGAAVGWSRVTFGAHTVAEVVAGWLLGMAVVCLIAALTGPPRGLTFGSVRVRGGVGARS